MTQNTKIALFLVAIVLLSSSVFAGAGCQTGTYTFNSAWEIRSFINNYYGKIIVKDIEPNSAALKHDTDTKLKICQLKGYGNVISSDSDYYRSCYDNGIVYWNGTEFVTINSCNYNHYISKLTCGGTCLIACNDDYDCDDSNLYTEDKCLNPGKVESSCSYTVIKCLSDYDCGVTGFIGKEHCFNNDVFKVFQKSVCTNAGTTSSKCEISNTPTLVKDCGDSYCDDFGANYCKDNNLYHSRTCYNKGCLSGICYFNMSSEIELVKVCAYGCSHNACLPECDYDYDCSNGQMCVNNQCVTECVDNDKDGYDTCNPGNPGDDGKPKDCNDNNANVHPNAVEVCNSIDDDCDGQIDEGTNICGTGKMCVQGQCVQLICSSDSQCDDGNIRTEDKCFNPGHSNSYCSHKNIVCFNNNECGCSRFLGQLFCKDNNSFDKYITYTCNNAGTGNSYCSNSTQDKLVNTCLNGCSISTGLCINQPVCINDADCSNGQVCVNNQCVEEEKECSTNSDCALGYYSTKFCKDNDVYRYFNEYSCVNNKCVKDKTEEFVKSCSYKCGSGGCISKGNGYNGETDNDPDTTPLIILSGETPGYTYIGNNYNLYGKNVSDEITVLTTEESTSYSLGYILLIILLVLIAIILIILLIIFLMR